MCLVFLQMDLQILTYVGLVTVFYCLFKLAFEVFEFWRVYFAPNKIDLSKFGKWSVITGPTGGLGECIAHQLASRGQNIILIARNKSKLENVANEISAKHGVETKCLVIDFTHNPSIYDEIKEFVSPYDVGVLVNNVGLGTVPSHFLDVVAHAPSIVTDTVRVNVLSYCKMIELLLPDMLQRGRGFILNISSVTVDRFTYSVYGASKTYENYFSLALSCEFEKSGVFFQSCTPSFFLSSLTNSFPSLFKKVMTSPEDLAKSLFITLGKSKKTYGCLSHALQALVLKCLPEKVLRYLIKLLWKYYQKANKNKDQ